MKQIKFFFACLLIFSFCMLSCGKEEPVSDYEREILGKITEGIGAKTRLPSFSRDLCVLDPEIRYDEELILSKYAGLFNETSKEVLYAKNAADRIYPASMTKVMTALLVAENCPDLTVMVPVTAEALESVREGSSLAGLVEGEKYSVSDLLAALLVPSGNDAANVLAVFIDGSIEAFVERMNSRAKELGMLNTHFVNANGLHDKNHYTSVYDLYLLMRTFITHRELAELASSRDATGAALQPDGSYIIRSWRSTNSICLGYTALPEGVSLTAAKTGYTVSAGRCLVIAVRSADGSDCIGVIAGAASHDALYEQIVKLLAQYCG